MEPNKESQDTQPKPVECPQDCTKCNTYQHIYCSTKMLFDLTRRLNNIEESNKSFHEEWLKTAKTVQELSSSLITPKDKITHPKISTKG